MAKPLSEERRQQWKDRINQQRSSGLSVPSWCRQNEIPVYNFRYWQNKFFPSTLLSRSSFTEIQSGNDDNKICLEYQGVKIHLSRYFDLDTLKRCLEVLKAC